MTRILGWVATVGLGVGVVSLGIAYALGGSDLAYLLGRSTFALRACKEGPASQAVAERRMTWSGGNAIDIALPATVRFRGGEGRDILVRGAPDLIANVDIDGSHLRLKCRWSTANRDIEIELPGSFRRVGLSGSGKVTMDNLNQRRLALRISGSGDISAQGTVERLSVTLAGSGNARLAELSAKELKVEIAGSGNVDATARDEADIRIAGSGDVRLHGHPARLKSRVAGSGRISQLEAAESKK